MNSTKHGSLNEHYYYTSCHHAADDDALTWTLITWSLQPAKPPSPDHLPAYPGHHEACTVSCPHRTAPNFSLSAHLSGREGVEVVVLRGGATSLGRLHCNNIRHISGRFHREKQVDGVVCGRVKRRWWWHGRKSGERMGY